MSLPTSFGSASATNTSFSSTEDTTIPSTPKNGQNTTRRLKKDALEPTPKKKSRRIPQELRDAFRSDKTEPLVPSESLKGKLERLRAEYQIKRKALIASAIAKAEPTIVTVQHGESVLILKTEEERKNQTSRIRKLLTSFHPAGSEERNRQLEYILDPRRACFGFYDGIGYTAPLGGVHYIREPEYNIWYNKAEQEDEKN